MKAITLMSAKKESIHRTPVVIILNGQYIATAMIEKGYINIKVSDIKIENPDQNEGFVINTQNLYTLNLFKKNGINALAFTNNETIISGGEDRVIQFWNIKNNCKYKPYWEHPQFTLSIITQEKVAIEISTSQPQHLRHMLRFPLSTRYLKSKTNALNRGLHGTRTNTNAQGLIQVIIDDPVAMFLQISEKIDSFLVR
jgi:WD40 repeat protein